MTFAALVLAEMLHLAVPAAPDHYGSFEFAESVDRETFRYHSAELSQSLDREAFRYQLADFCQSIDHGAFRYRLADFSSAVHADAAHRYGLSEFADAVEHDVERCICMTTRMSQATLKAEVLLVGDCECGK
jgi:hypothetical protein